MANLSTNYKFILPEPTDYYNVANSNDNFIKVDANLHALTPAKFTSVDVGAIGATTQYTDYCKIGKLVVFSTYIAWDGPQSGTNQILLTLPYLAEGAPTFTVASSTTFSPRSVYGIWHEGKLTISGFDENLNKVSLCYNTIKNSASLRITGAYICK